MTGAQAGRPGFAEFHNALYGAEPAGSFVELRIARPRGGMEQRFFDVRDVAGAEALVAERAPAADVYAGVAPRTRREGTRAAVERLHVLYVDVDGDRAKLRAFRPLPSIVVASGSGVHGYWPMAEAIAPDEAEAANRQLATAVDGDMRSTDAARILRPPASFNHKGAEPRPVEMLRCKAEVFTVGDVVGQLPPPVDPSRGSPLPRSARREFAAEDVLATISPPAYVRLLAGVDVPEQGGMIRCPLPGHEDRTPSFYCYPTPEAGTYCFGCGRGGSLVDFAAALWNVEPRGRGFHDLRRRLASELLGMEVRS